VGLLSRQRFTNCVFKLHSVNVSASHQDDLFLKMTHDILESESGVRVPEDLDFTFIVVEARKYMHLNDELTVWVFFINELHMKPIKLIIATLEVAFVIKFVKHGIKSKE
jgi:hypothetical protein